MIRQIHFEYTDVNRLVNQRWYNPDLEGTYTI